MAERFTIIEFVEKYVAQFSESPFLWEKNLDTNEWVPTTYAETLKKAKNSQHLTALKEHFSHQCLLLQTLTKQLQ